MIAIIKYNAGNIQSVQNALNRLGQDAIITDNAELICKADKVIFPGVGEASSAMAYLAECGLDKVIPTLKQPVLGICLGLQLMCKYSEEGDTACLGIFNTNVKKFPPLGIVPHIGWNNCERIEGQLFEGLSANADCYYVHSYYAEPCDEAVALGDYILPFSAALQKDNFYATQFHPEKSAGIGARILSNFIKL